MKIIVTTSDNYHHCLPVFFAQYNKYWGEPFDLVGYKKPEIELPENCTWVSLGEQRGPEYFSEDLRSYFQNQDQYFVWLMEDTFIKGLDKKRLEYLYSLTALQGIGRINLTKEGTKQTHLIVGELVFNTHNSLYRLSTQPSIWNKDFLLRYMTPGLTPWKFETQDTLDAFDIVGPLTNVLEHNEGVRKHDIHKLNLEGIEN